MLCSHPWCQASRLVHLLEGHLRGVEAAGERVAAFCLALQLAGGIVEYFDTVKEYFVVEYFDSVMEYFG
jgi:hypothetical protein